MKTIHVTCLFSVNNESKSLCVCSQRLLFFKLQLKKTISDCRKYRFCLGIFSLHFHICTVVKEQDMYRVVERVQLLLDLPWLSRQQKKKHMVKQKKKNIKQMPQPMWRQLIFCTLRCSRCETILCPFSDAARTNPALRTLRNKQLHEIENKYFTTIH